MGLFRKKNVVPPSPDEEDHRSERVLATIEAEFANLAATTSILKQTVDRLVRYEEDRSKRGSDNGQ
jgi:hypothetical protein